MDSNTNKCPYEELLRSAQITSRSRFNAMRRLDLLAKVTFFMSILFSLGLIFIPLIQNAVKLNLDEKILNSMQVFLAIATLCYSLVIGAARWEIRIDKLRKCGDTLKSLVQEMRRNKCNEIFMDKLEEYQSIYEQTIIMSDPHSDSDYFKALKQIDDKDGKEITLKTYQKICISWLTCNFLPYIPTFVLLGIEAWLICKVIVSIP
jgi:hypothetical protein